MKRKHQSANNSTNPSKKRKQKHEKPIASSTINHSVLSSYYDRVVTLRDFILERLSERVKSKRVTKLIKCFQRKPKADSDGEFHQFLDSVLVSHDKHVRWTDESARKRDFVVFSQACSQALSATVPSTIGQDVEPKADLQIEVVNYVIWSLFRTSNSQRNEHLLCQGFGGASSSNTFHSGIPNIVCQYPNGHVETLTNRCWCHLLSTLGKGGEVLMADILLKCAVFMPTSSTDGQDRGNYYQLSGFPLSTVAKTVKTPKNVELDEATKEKITPNSATRNKSTLSNPRPPSEVRLVRNRIFYSRPTFNSKGRVRLGLRHVHVLNRYTNLSEPEETIHMAKYIFPRQFGLHNVFTSTVDPRETTQPFKDYTIRDREIEELALKSSTNNKLKLPKRLRSGPIDLIGRIRKAHKQISYVELLRHYCPIDQNALDESSSRGTQSDIISCFATPVSNCAAFVKAVFNHFLPSNCFGESEDGSHNRSIILDAVEHFVRRRKFESLTLHDILQNIKIAAIPWLRPPNVGERCLSKSDFDKRKELLSEFIYWLFDSYLIPLIRSNFHVTESNKDKNKLYYFRLDAWHQLTSPAFVLVKTSMYEEMPSVAVKKLLSLRRMGYSNLRLLPKSNTFRPIMNLRRRPEYISYGRRLLGQSINSLLNPVHKALHYEAFRRPNTLGSSLLSVSAIHPALKSFKSLLVSKNLAGKQLYFAKIDVKSCFDSLPQSKVLELATQLLATTKYALTKHAEVSTPQIAAHSSTLKHRVRFIATGHSTKRIAHAADDARSRLDGHGRKDTVYVSPLNRQVQTRDQLLKLLKEHVERNIVKIGKKFYRQNEGVPQGSVVSSLLCSLVYTALETTQLKFIKDSGNSVLLRLIDDFLVVTTDKGIAVRFLDTMCAGIPEYGVEVKKPKSLVNFDVSIGGERLTSLEGFQFPYCGIKIDTRTLDITKDISSITHSSLSNSLTIDASSTPGQTFRLKALNGLPIHLHAMYFDTEHNSLRTVLMNVYRTFGHAALRMYHYIRGLRASQRPSVNIVIETIRDMVGLVYGIVRNRCKRWVVSKAQMRWLASKAFVDVIRARQTGMGGIVVWLEGEMVNNWPTRTAEGRILKEMVRAGELVMEINK